MVTMLDRGDQVPHFAVKDVSGASVQYAALWQRRNLVLVALPDATAGDAAAYEAAMRARTGEFRSLDAECVITRDAVDGLPAPGVLVADRWGEVAHVVTASEIPSLPDPADLLEWLEWIQHRCPECEGEAK